MKHAKYDVWIGQYRVMARRVAPNSWKSIVIDADVPGGGTVLHGGARRHGSPVEALWEGQKRVEALLWRHRLRLRCALK